MAKFKITKETTVAGLKQQFAEQIGGTLRVYDGHYQATDDVALVSLGAKIGELECRTSRTVGAFEETMVQMFNLKVKVFTTDDWVKVLDGITLETIKNLPRQTRIDDMKKYIAYKRSVVLHPNPKNPDGYYKEIEKIEANLPCAKSIALYEKYRASLQKYVDQEDALERLFNEMCPKNSDLEDILIKCSTLNDFYSTQIYNTHEVALHYKNFDIDKRIKEKDLSLVNDLALVNVGHGKQMYFYSFASKYCSHHRPEVYPIYDSFVGKMLTYFLHRDGFVKFAQNDLKDYPKFVNIINAFKEFYGLGDFSLLQIDNYLWLLGKDVEQEKLEKKNSQSL